MRIEPAPRTPLKRTALGEAIVGALFIVGGVVVQMRLLTGVLACERGADGATSCVLEKQILGVLSTSHETIEGLKGARSITLEESGYRGRPRDYYRVVLDAASGEHELGESRSDTAPEVALAINQQLKRGAVRFEAALRVGPGGQLYRFGFLLVSLVGVWQVICGLRRWFEGPRDPATNA